MARAKQSKGKDMQMIEIDISRAITSEYNRRLADHFENDVVIVGGGPAGLAAGFYLAKAGVKTLILEKRLSIGGGIWGGAAGYCVIALEDTEITDDVGISTKKQKGLYLADAIEFASGLAYKTKKAGAEILNLMQAEDIILKNKVVEGIVVNNTAIVAAGLHVDPYCISSKYLVDATGHAAEVVVMLRKRKPDLFPKGIQEGFMDVEKSETSVVEKTGEVYPGLYLAGMSVASVFNLPRMGPIFGGMLKSGRKAAEMINAKMRPAKS
jgi:thiamine thiazole synthase